MATPTDHEADGLAFFSLLTDDAFLEADRFFKVELEEFNDTGAEGEVLMALDEDTGRLTIAIAAEGLEPDQVHIQHIHGFPDGTQARVPDQEDDDADGDGFLELLEGVPAYGPVLLNIRLDHEDGTGGANGHSHEEGFEGFPTAPDGLIRFVETFQLPVEELPDPPELLLRHVVIHGASVEEGDGAGTGGEVDGTAGYKLILPALIGEIEEISPRKALNRLEDFVEDALEDRFAELEDRFDDLEDRLDDLIDGLRDQVRDSVRDGLADAGDWVFA